MRNPKKNQKRILKNQRPSFRIEKRLVKKGFKIIAGVDEVGVGAWAGPVVAAAVILPLKTRNFTRLGIKDSKQLTAARRKALANKIYQMALDVGVGVVDVAQIDAMGIGSATRVAMEQALRALKKLPQLVLVDGRGIPCSDLPTEAVVKGDVLSISIASASIVAKVVRDEIMAEVGGKLFSEFSFERHKGYGTRLHQKLLKKCGASPWHRQNYRPIRILNSGK